MNNENPLFVYRDGTTVQLGDVIIAASQPAKIEMILIPGTIDAQNFSCADTGGLLLKFDNGDMQLWPSVNEDLELVRRKTE